MRAAGDTPEGRADPIRQTPYSAAANEVIYNRGTRPEVFAVCQGWALRYIQLADGRRQNLGVLLPGDLSLSTLFEEKLHYSVQAVTDLRITQFACADLKRTLLGDANMLEFFGKSYAAERRYSDELAVDLGRRSAEERVTHLMLTILDRISGHHIRPDHPYAFPLLQRHIADLTGLTSVHVSRMMKEFRNVRLMKLSKRFLTITDLRTLEGIARQK
jgi:CRP-like cAMP-binding protein